MTNRRSLFIGVLIALAVLGALWKVFLADGASKELEEKATELIRSAQESPFTPFIMLAMFVVGGFVLLPVTILVAATVIIFEPAAGIAYALGGVSASAAAGFFVGRYLGKDYLDKRLHAAFEKINRHAKRHGVLAVFVIRHMPIAPFTIVNMLMGATQISFTAMVLGTMLGFAPGILIMYYLKSWV